MPLHIGIVGCSAEGASLCCRTICAEGAASLGPHARSELSLRTPSLAGYVTCLDRGDIAGVARLMLASAHKLVRMGADFPICRTPPFIRLSSWWHRSRRCPGCGAARSSPSY